MSQAAVVANKSAGFWIEEAQELKPQLIEFRRDLHRFPELSMQEVETTRKIREFLEKEGIRILPLDLPVGVLAEVEGSGPGPIVALRADIDALPITEETGLPYASEIQGRMHACGHDFHTSAILGAAVLLKKNAHRFRGKVRLLFQPAEEKGTGAAAMIKAGALDGVQIIFGMHNKPELPVGTVGIREGALMASVDGFKITVRGKGGHAAVPDAAIDPIVAASAIVSGIQTAVSRNTSPFDRAVVSVCSFHAGTTWNVIPEQAELDGTVRTFRPEVRARLPELIQRIAGGIAAGYGAETAFRWFAGIPTVHNATAAAALFRSAAEALDLRVVEAVPSAGGEDFAFYQEQVPGGFIWMGTGGKEEWHHPKFTVDEEAFVPASALFALTAVKALEQASAGSPNIHLNPVTIRDIRSGDKPVVAELMVEAYLQYEDFMSADLWEAYRRAIIDSVDNDAPEARIVAELNGEIVGTVQLFLSSETAYGRPELGIHSPIIRYLSVSPKARGLGIATALIKESVRRAASLGASTLHLHTTDMMESAVKLYERLGFERAFDKDIHNGEALVKCYRIELDQLKTP